MCDLTIRMHFENAVTSSTACHVSHAGRCLRRSWRPRWRSAPRLPRSRWTHPCSSPPQPPSLARLVRPFELVSYLLECTNVPCQRTAPCQGACSMLVASKSMPATCVGSDALCIGACSQTTSNLGHCRSNKAGADARAVGQANYAAANAALEAWAGAEASRGTVSMAVQWGAWAAGALSILPK